MDRPGKRWIAAVWIGLGLICAGCATAGRRGETTSAPGRREASPRRSDPADGFVLRPVVTVTEVENRAGFSGAWNLGDGMAELLTTRLVKSDAVTVVERREPGGAITELTRQARDLFRPEGRAARGRLMNARYLIRGAVTDFTVTGDTSGWFQTPSAGVRARRSVASVAVHLSVSDVETGQIIASMRGEGRVSSRAARGDFSYRAVQFGGDAFSRTPLGRATEGAIDQAAHQLLAALPREIWAPRVAEGGRETALINGGLQVGLEEGMEFIVRTEGRRITDPRTGDVIDLRPGPMKGRLRVIEVRPSASTALVLEGEAARGDHLEPVLP